MGNFFNNQRLPENQDSSSSPHYYYPSRNGKFFGSNFIMGGDKFEMAQPEAYLFGDNLDLNYLGGKPNPFPYNAPHPNEPMHMLRSLINIRKETLKLLCTNSDLSDEPQYTIEFVFDSDVDCNITVYFICNEECSVSGMKYISKDVKHRSQQYNYKAGMGQLFSQTNALFDPHQYDAADLLYQVLDEKGEFNSSTPFPVVIHCVAEEGDDPKQSHSLIATIEKVCDDIFSLKPIKQKIFVDGLSYLLQEIYGIENKVNKLEKNYDDDNDNSFECVICMSDLRDTLILPCRHLCLCKSCANSLRYQASNCPICRVPFRALLQIKAVKRLLGNLSSQIIFTETLNDVIIDIPSGFETVPLVEALNGINPQLTYLNLKQSLERLPESDKNNKKDSDSVRSSSKNDIEDVHLSECIQNLNSLDKQTDYKINNNGDEFNMKYFYKQKTKYVVPTGEDSVSASSSSSGNVESIQEKTRLLTEQKQRPKTKISVESNPDTSQASDCDPSSITNSTLQTDKSIDSDLKIIDILPDQDDNSP